RCDPPARAAIFPPAHGSPPLPTDVASLQGIVRELLATVADLRKTVEAQQLRIAVSLYVLMRFGLLAYLGAVACRWFLFHPMLTCDTDAWHALNGAIPATVTIAIAAFGCYTATGGQLFKEGFLGND